MSARQICQTGFFLYWVAFFIAYPLLAVELVYDTGIEKDMTFFSSFDKGVDADSALGDKNGVALSGIPAEKLQAPGLRNQALRTGYDPERKERYTVNYSPEKNLSAETGTVMFWIKSEDWPANGSWSIARENIGKWLTGEWHFITCTWTPDELRLYVDGKMKSAVPRKGYEGSAFTSMQVGALGWDVESGLSLMDELKIYSKPLDADTIAAEFAKYGVSNQDKIPLVTVGRKTPELDGEIKDGEYAFSGAGFLETNGKYADRQSRYYLSYDNENLYVSVSSPQEKALKSENNIHDSNLWLDDSVELWLHRVKDDTRYQIIVNSHGAVFDTRHTKISDPSWDLDGLRSFSRHEKGVWTIKLALPLKSLDMKSDDDWRVNIARTFQADGLYFTCISPVRRQLGYSDKANFYRLSLSPDSPVINFSGIGDLNGGNISIRT
jgi:hypothetical protein